MKNSNLKAVGTWWQAHVNRSLKAIGRWCLTLTEGLMEGLRAWWQVGCLCRENFVRRRKASRVDRERQAAYLELGLREEGRSSPLAMEERRCVAQAMEACRAAEELREAHRKAWAAVVRQTAAEQERCEQALAGEHERCRRAMERVRGNRKDAEARAVVEHTIRRIKELRWAWQADYAQARREGLRLKQAVEEAGQAVAAREAVRAEARRKLGTAVFLAGEVKDALGQRIQAVEREWTRLEADKADAVGTMRQLARAGRRTAVILVVALILLIGGTVSYRIWHRANLQEKVKKIRGDIGRQDREKSETEKLTDKYLESDELRIVE